jgi:hypothetical protein
MALAMRLFTARLKPCPTYLKIYINPDFHETFDSIGTYPAVKQIKLQSQTLRLI